MLAELFPRVHQRYTCLAVLGPTMEGFADFLVGRGYPVGPVRRHLRTAREIDARLRRRGTRSIAEIRRAVLRACGPPIGRSQDDELVASTIRLLEIHLSEKGVLPADSPVQSLAAERLSDYAGERDHPAQEATLKESLFSDMMNDMLDNPYYNDYWRQFAVDERWGEIDVPIFHYASWYDRYPHSQVKHFNGIRRLGGPHARNAQKLFIGPWLHGAGEVTPRIIGDVDFGPEAAIDYNALRLRWFDYHLKGIENGIMDEPPVRIFVMGENRWRDEKEFPPSRAVATEYFFRQGPSGSIDSLNDGLLSTSAPGTEKADSFHYDPRRPVPSIGGDLFVEPSGARDHRPADRLSLTYTTPPLERDVEVTGWPRVLFHASSSAVDTDWVVTITDVHPDGYSQILRQNILRARYRESDERPVLLEPGKVYPFTIELYPISNLFRAGHRIRIAVASSSFPKWYPNGNTGREMAFDRPPVIAENTVFHDSRHPSKVVLPVVPR